MTLTSRIILVLAILPIAGLAVNGVVADEAPDGETLYTDLGCVYCHGVAGKEPPLSEYPKLAGQNEAYLAQQTRDIKDRARVNGYTGMMQPAVINITDAEIAAISAYLAAQPR